MLRAKQIGLSFDELDNLEIGMIFDLMVEMANDSEKYPEKASQDDINKLLG